MSKHYTFGLEIECFIHKDAENLLKTFIDKNALPLSLGADGSIEIPSELKASPVLAQKFGITLDSDSVERDDLTDCEIRTDKGLSFVEVCDTARRLTAYLQKLERAGLVGVNKSCGLHIHVGVNELSHTQLEAIYMLWSTKLEQALYNLLPRSRRDNRYCRSTQGISFASWSAGEKYLSLSAHYKRGSVPTIEWRVFSATLSTKKLINWLRLIRAIVETSTLYSFKTDRNPVPTVSGTDPLASVLTQQPSLVRFLVERYRAFGMLTRGGPQDDARRTQRTSTLSAEHKTKIVQFFRSVFGISVAKMFPKWKLDADIPSPISFLGKNIRAFCEGDGYVEDREPARIIAVRDSQDDEGYNYLIQFPTSSGRGWSMTERDYTSKVAHGWTFSEPYTNVIHRCYNVQSVTLE